MTLTDKEKEEIRRIAFKRTETPSEYGKLAVELTEQAKDREWKEKIEKAIKDLYSKHKNCKPMGFMCLEQFIDELKKELLGEEK